MSLDKIRTALTDIAAETDPALKHLKLGSLVSAVFRERGIELVVVGGSAIEFYTEGAYTSGDIDLCILSPSRPLTLRARQEIMGQLGAIGGPRSWEVAGTFVDLLGNFENLARTPARSLAGPYGDLKIAPAEELIAERVLVANYPQDYPPARDCARKLLAVALRGELEIDWAEVKRLAEDSAYANWADVKSLTDEQAKALQVRSPYNPPQ